MRYADEITVVLNNHGAIERLAEVEHTRWAHWQNYLHDQCQKREDGALIIPAELVSGWERQIRTPYAELSPEEHESDREQVRLFLPTLISIFAD